MANIQERKKNFSTAMETAAYQNLIAQTIPDEKQRDRFKASILSAVAVNPALRECEAGTILAAAFLGESLGLSPSPQLGQYYMVPFKDTKNNVTNAVFVLGYKGYIQMAIRSGYYKKIVVMPVKEGELAKYNRLTEEIVLNSIEDDAKHEAAKTIGYYAKIELKSGFVKEMYWSKEKMMIHADRYSKAYNMATGILIQEKKIPENELWKYSSFWYKDFDIMAQKTMIRQIIGKWGVLSQELIDAYSNDDAVMAMNADGKIEVASIGLASEESQGGEPDGETPTEPPAAEKEAENAAPQENKEAAESGEKAEEITFDEI